MGSIENTSRAIIQLETQHQETTAEKLATLLIIGKGKYNWAVLKEDCKMKCNNKENIYKFGHGELS